MPGGSPRNNEDRSAAGAGKSGLSVSAPGLKRSGRQRFVLQTGAREDGKRN